MATVTGKTVQYDQGYVEYRWEGLGNGDDGSYISSMAKFPIKTAMFGGTFSTNTVSLQGSMDATNWVDLNSTRIASSANVSLSGIGANSIEGILENPRYIRPLVDSAGGTPSIDVIIIASKRI